MNILKKKTKVPASKLNAFQAQQEREQAELLDEYWTILLFAVAGLAVSTALAVIIVNRHNSAIKATFLFPLFTAPYIVVQRRRINKAACAYSIFTAD